MAVFQEYKKIQDKFAKDLLPLDCSESFSSFRRADTKIVNALKGMDAVAGKTSAAMQDAAEAFTDISTPYFSKLEGQVRKEARGAQKLIKKELTKFQFKIFRVIEDFRADAEKLADSESKADGQADVRGQGGGAAEAAAAKANERKLAQAIKAFNDRRNAHLAASVEVLRATQQAAGAVSNLRKAAARQLAQAETLAGGGNADGAMGMVPAIAKMSTDSVKLADAALAKHTRDLKDKFQKERNMRFGTLQKEFDLDDSGKVPFERNQKAKARVFTQATDNGKEALEMIAQMRVDADEIAAMAGQAEAAAEGGERLRQFVLRDLTSGGSSSGGLIRKAIDEYRTAVDSLNNRMESTIGAVRTFRSNTDPEQAETKKEAAVSFGNVLLDASNTAQRKWDRLETTFKNVQRKIPGQFSKDGDVVAALRGFLTDMAEIKRTHAGYRKNVTGLEKILSQL